MRDDESKVNERNWRQGSQRLEATAQNGKAHSLNRFSGAVDILQLPFGVHTTLNRSLNTYLGSKEAVPGLLEGGDCVRHQWEAASRQSHHVGMMVWESPSLCTSSWPPGVNQMYQSLLGTQGDMRVSLLCRCWGHPRQSARRLPPPPQLYIHLARHFALRVQTCLIMIGKSIRP